MGQTEITIFIFLANLILLIFIIGIGIFILKYRKKKLQYEKEKIEIEKQHKLDLLHNQLQIQQQTMQFIGSEIHDSVAQKLTLASIYSQKLEFENKFPDMKDRIHHISSIINASLVELRELSKTLTNTHIRDAGFTELLHDECEKINETSVCRMHVHSDFDKEMSVTVKSFLLRVIQEFVQNSLKHSGCSLIKVELKNEGDGLCIIASDNGKGFDSSNIHSSGIGLGNMKRRIHLIGGKFSLQSEPGKGTTLALFIDNKKMLSE
jgi:signal transduction histidine kinase